MENFVRKYSQKIDLQRRDDREQIVRAACIAEITISDKKPRSCFGVKYQVVGSAVNRKYRGQKYGRMIYGLVMTYIYPEFLMSDRESVSPSAKRMWASFDSNPKIQKVPPDKPPYIGKFDNIHAKSYPSTSPTKDDCAVPNAGKDDFLMRGYRYTSAKNRSLLKQLESNHQGFLKKISQDDEFKAAFDGIYWEWFANMLFQLEYIG